jgi:hypothetical protein
MGARQPVPDGSATLRRRRDELVAHVAELHWDLGGLAYEMAIRDHFRLDVLVSKAAELQERDAELGELERVLSMQDSAGAGQCSSCGALRSRGAVYCWQCGTALMERTPSASAASSDAHQASQVVPVDPNGTVGSANGGTASSQS